MISGHVLNAGVAGGPVLLLDEPVSFWGAFDPRTGVIVDTHHPQCGTCMTGYILMLPETRGSGGTPGGIAEAIRRGTGPAGIILIKPDVNLAIGAATASALYGKHCPVIAVSEADYITLSRAPRLSIDEQGGITPA